MKKGCGVYGGLFIGCAVYALSKLFKYSSVTIACSSLSEVQHELSLTRLHNYLYTLSTCRAGLCAGSQWVILERDHVDGSLKRVKSLQRVGH